MIDNGKITNTGESLFSDVSKVPFVLACIYSNYHVFKLEILFKIICRGFKIFDGNKTDVVRQIKNEEVEVSEREYTEAIKHFLDKTK